MPKADKKSKRSAYLSTLYRFGYDLVCVGATKKEVVDAIMKNYDEAYQSENGCDPRKQFSYGPDSSDYDTAKSELYVREMDFGCVEWC